MKKVNTEIHKEENRIVIEQDNDEIWVLYDEYFDEWLVTNRSRSTSQEYYHDEDRAVIAALTEIGVLS
jgi:hypothetical protein